MTYKENFNNFVKYVIDILYPSEKNLTRFEKWEKLIQQWDINGEYEND